jgi:hypothetical protein
MATVIAIPKKAVSVAKDSQGKIVKLKVLSAKMWVLTNNPVVAMVNAHPKDAFAMWASPAKIVQNPVSTVSQVNIPAIIPMENATKKKEPVNAKKDSEVSIVLLAVA